MSQININETQLPGVGVQHDFMLEEGGRIGVITHHSGRRDFLMYSADDPDMCAKAIALSEQESELLGEMLGASKVVETIGNIQQSVGGLAIDWIPVRDNWKCSTASIKDLGLYETGTQIVAVIRETKTIPAPQPSFHLQSGDTAVVVGTPEGIKEAYHMMQGDT